MTIMTRPRSRSIDVRRGFCSDAADPATAPAGARFSGEAADGNSNNSAKVFPFKSQIVSSHVARTRELYAQPNTFAPALGDPLSVALLPRTRRRRKPNVLMGAIL